jgi:hypothetical protein
MRTEHRVTEIANACLATAVAPKGYRVVVIAVDPKGDFVGVASTPGTKPDYVQAILIAAMGHGEKT